MRPRFLPLRRLALLAVAVALTLVAVASAWAGTTGKIAGRVTDDTGAGVPFVNVVIVGTTQGAATDLDGYYNILSVVPGLHAVRVSAIGFDPQTKEGIRVSVDQTATVNFRLGSQPIEMNTVEVTADRAPLVQRDVTASQTSITEDQIAAVPAENIGTIINQTAGVQGDHFRGGRSGEVGYWVDGVPVTDVYNGSQVTTVEPNAISELQIITGAFNAEYGQAMSGIVNIITKDGDNKFTGSISTYAGDYVSTNKSRFYNIESINPAAVRNVTASLSGPVVSNHLYFFGNARYYHNEGYLFGQRLFTPDNLLLPNNPRNTLPTTSTKPPQLLAPKGDGAAVAMNPYTKYSGQLKLSSQLFPGFRAAFNTLYDQDEGQNYSQAYKYNPDGRTTNYSDALTNILNLNHVLGSGSTFYTLNLTRFRNHEKNYAFESPTDPRYQSGSLQAASSDRALVNQIFNVNGVPTVYGGPEYGFLVAGTDNGRFDRTTTTVTGKLDLTSQLNNRNLVKFGLEARRHDLQSQYIYISDPTFDQINQLPNVSRSARDSILFNNGYDSNGRYYGVIPDATTQENNALSVKPIELSAYLQDKVEYENFIVNIGLRVDYFNPNAQVPVDPQDPTVTAPRKDVNRYQRNADGSFVVDANGDRVATTLAQRQAYWFRDAKTSLNISPRLGIAFPISDRGKLWFSYGHFLQIPNFSLLYTNPEYELGGGSGIIGTIGNPELKPQRTIQGEIGVQQQLTDDIGIELTTFFRDIRDLVSASGERIELQTTERYVRYANADYGIVKGVIFDVTKRFGASFSFNANYTFSTAEGTASDPNAQAGSIFEPTLRLQPLDWDQKHRLNLTASYSRPNSFAISATSRIGTGYPYGLDPTRSVVAALRAVTDLGTVTDPRRPSNFDLDMQASKDFNVGGIRLGLYTKIYNVLDIQNQVNVFGDTGTADYSAYRDESIARRPEIANTITEFFNDPTRYSSPRQVLFGLNVNF